MNDQIAIKLTKKFCEERGKAISTSLYDGDTFPSPQFSEDDRAYLARLTYRWRGFEITIDERQGLKHDKEN